VIKILKGGNMGSLLSAEEEEVCAFTPTGYFKYAMPVLLV
jgi:hypothetical protein